MLRAGPELPGWRRRRVTHREDAHADWGLQQARHLEPSHPAAADAGAGAGTFDSQVLGQPQVLIRNVRQADENGPRFLDTAGGRPGPAEGRTKGYRAGGLLTNRPLRNSSYSQPGLEVGADGSPRMRTEDLRAPPAARAGGGRSLGGGVSLRRS